MKLEDRDGAVTKVYEVDTTIEANGDVTWTIQWKSEVGSQDGDDTLFLDGDHLKKMYSNK